MGNVAGKFGSRVRSGPFMRAYVPWCIEWQRLGVTGAERGVLDTLCAVLRFDESGRAYASRPREEIARLLGKSGGAVKQLAHSLVRKGALSVKEPARKGHAAVYWVTPGIPWPELSGNNGKPMPKPSFQEVESFFKEQHLASDPQRFFSYYENVGWVTKNGTPISDWHGSARAWDGREGKPAKPGSSRAPSCERRSSPSADDIMVARGVSRDEAEMLLLAGDF